MSKPTSKACINSAALGLAQLLTLTTRMTDEQVDEVMDNDEAIRLDVSVHSLLDYAEREEHGR